MILQITYRSGINFIADYILEPIGSGSETFEAFCLDKMPQRSTHYHIVASINDLANINDPLQEEWVKPKFRQPLNEVLNLTIEEFTEIALQDDPCIEINQDTVLDQ